MKPDQRPRLLIIRFSSYGDLMHAAGVPRAFQAVYPEAKVDWLVRADLKGVVEDILGIDAIIPFQRDRGFFGLISLATELNRRRYTHVYDAHNNVRSFFVFNLLRLLSLGRVKTLRRSKDRFKRLMLFTFRKNFFVWPHRSAESFLRPLTKWGLSGKLPSGPELQPRAPLPPEIANWASAQKSIVAFAPSAAWEMKRWPLEHWKSLIQKLPNRSIALLGGPEDTFLKELEGVAPNRVINLAGKLSLAQSMSMIAKSDLVIANDTGSMHVADQLERPTIALIGPTAFGYPSHTKSETLEIDLWCKPCSKDGRGTCVNDVYRRCLVDIAPERVARTAEQLLAREGK